jgi:GNAT superfamily N-acetyltransferase
MAESIRQKWRRHGALGLARRGLRALPEKLRAAWNHAFNEYNFVFRYDKSVAVDPRTPEGFSVRRMADAAELTPEFLAMLAREFEVKTPETFPTFVGAKGCVLWVAYGGDRPACITLSRRGRHIPRWFLELRPDDVLLFRVKTAADFRGKGFSPALTRHILAEELRDGGNAYWDCRVYNRPSIRAAEKAGFRIVAKMKPITEVL